MAKSLARQIEDALAEAVADMPNARRALIEDQDIEIGIAEIGAFILRRQRVLEDAVLTLAREMDEKANKPDQ